MIAGTGLHHAFNLPNTGGAHQEGEIPMVLVRQDLEREKTSHMGPSVSKEYCGLLLSYRRIYKFLPTEMVVAIRGAGHTSCAVLACEGVSCTWTISAVSNVSSVGFCAFLCDCFGTSNAPCAAGFAPAESSSSPSYGPVALCRFVCRL